MLMSYHAQTAQKLGTCKIEVDTLAKSLWAPTRALIILFRTVGFISILISIILGVVATTAPVDPTDIYAIQKNRFISFAVNSLFYGIGLVMLSYLLRYVLDLHIMMLLLLDTHIRQNAPARAAQPRQPQQTQSFVAKGVARSQTI